MKVEQKKRLPRQRGAIAFLLAFLAFACVGGQLVRLALQGQGLPTAAALRTPLPISYARPDIVDRNGRLLATDVVVPSLFADPARVLNAGDVVDQLQDVLSDLDRIGLASALSDKSRRFAWVKRHMSPALAQNVHDLGLPGLAFREEIGRVYPRVALAGHVLGNVNIDNKGLSGFERFLDQRGWVKPVYGVTRSDRAPIQMSLDLAVQQALSAELSDAIRRYKSKAAAGVVLDVKTGEILAVSSLPSIDPSRPTMAQDKTRPDRVFTSTYELGSVFKLLTIAMALDASRVTPETMVDVRRPLSAGGHTIRDLHPISRPLSVTEIFLRSSNIGAGALALELGKNKQQEFLRRTGILHELETEAGKVARAQLPESWSDVETVTVSYGHGIAVAPMQFAAAAASLVNGGRFVRPTLLRQDQDVVLRGAPILKRSTSLKMRELMRLNVRDKSGTGWRADVPGYRVGGKTGTAELPKSGGYDKKSVIASFVGAFPMDDPAYLTFVMLFEPQPVPETAGRVTAGRNAAPATGRLIKRIAPLLGVVAQK